MNVLEIALERRRTLLEEIYRLDHFIEMGEVLLSNQAPLTTEHSAPTERAANATSEQLQAFSAPNPIPVTRARDVAGNFEMIDKKLFQRLLIEEHRKRRGTAPKNIPWENETDQAMPIASTG